MGRSKRFWRGLFFLLLIAALCGGLVLPAVSLPAHAAPQMQKPATDIVISEFRARGSAGGNDEFIELFNPTQNIVNLNGWSISRSNDSGNISAHYPFTADIFLQPGQFYLLANTGYDDAVIPDTTYGVGITDAGGIALLRPDNSIADQVGFGNNSSYKEGTVLTSLGSNNQDRSYERKPGGPSHSCQDTNDNLSDFQLHNPSNPQTSTSPLLPCVTITNVTSSTVDGTYGPAATIDITVTFNAAVTVSGLPTLLLETGPTDRNATYVSGSGSNTLTFTYTVMTGDSSSDLDYLSSDSLSGGTITSAFGTVILVLPAPGSPGSLGANKNIVIDNGIAPSVVSFTRQTPNFQATNADSLTFRVTFNEDVTNVDTSDFSVSGTTGATTLALVSASVYDLTVAGGDLSTLNGTVGLNLSGTQDIVDGTGNSLSSTEPSIDQTYTLDNIAPSVTVNQASGQLDPTSTLPISFTVVFSEPIDASTFIAADITQTGTATGITWTITDSGDHRNFTLRATAITGAGTAKPTIAAAKVKDLAGNDNVASTSADNTVTYASAATVLINEVAWAGTVASSDDEWIELYNPSATATVDLTGWVLKSNDNTPNISLNGHSIPPNEFLLLARRDGTFSGGLTPDIIYGGNALNNGGEILSLIDSAGKTVDTANADGGAWPAGLASPTYASMERVVYANQWATYAGTVPIAYDRNNNAVKGTPGTSNWITTATVTTITSDLPDPSLVNQDVTVNVTVVGGTKVPVGKVNIMGANTNCSITLSANGTGSCKVRFTSVGTKTITATYTGNTATGHAPSSDTETHQVSTSVIRTPTRVPTAVPPPPLIAINEFVPRPGHDWNNDGVINAGDEYIELINHGVIDVNLTGYSLDDEVNIGSTPYRLPAVTMKPGERRVFYGSETGLLLSDGGDGVRLLKPNGQLGDAYNYRVVRFPDQSYCRLPDNGGADDWNQNCYPTPGLQNSLSASSVRPPISGDAENLCPIADTLPPDFVLAECPPAGLNVWNPAYWDRNGWYGERFLPGSPGKWNVFVD